MKKHISILLALTGVTFYAAAQQCSPDALAAKYWQYRKNFNDHFIVIDRTPEGCVNDGIGQQGNGSCEFSKAGYSLPATSINMAPNGAYGLGKRNNSNDPNWYDPACGNDPNPPGTSWETNAKHNYLDMGSETPHQLGWYWVVLATEYEMLKRNGQLQEAQRTLEEIFLALQAYRRLDMQAQCMVDKRYQEITDDFEVETCLASEGLHHVPYDCLCGQKYQADGHSNFGTPCYDNCDFTPQLDGYSGFYLREDATQNLEHFLHDQSQDKYNIDLVASDYAMSLSPPCSTTFSQPCWLAHKQDYMSQDGMTGLFLGLAMIKRYIPANAEITTCDGTKYKPQEMAVKIASALVNRVDNAYLNRISWPKSDDCCDKEVFLSEKEGGRLLATITGFKAAATYLDGAERHSSVQELLGWAGLRKLAQSTQSSNSKFWLRLMAIGWDMGMVDPGTQMLFYSDAEEQNLDILVLMNNLLHPGGNNLPTDRNFFEEFLCEAPCEGPCLKRDDYPDGDPNWPEFNCANTPRWKAQDWEITEGNGNSRQFNGLNFMAMYNIYMLHYNQSAQNYYNPEQPPYNGAFGADKIEGPGVLCTDQTAYYEAQPLYCMPYDPASTPQCVQNITWSGSDNLNISDIHINGTNVHAIAHQSNSFIQASFDEERQITRYMNKVIHPFPFPFPIGQTKDICQVTYRKPIITKTPYYNIKPDEIECDGMIVFTAEGEILPGIQMNWTITDLQTGTVTYDQGVQAYVFVDDYFNPVNVQAVLTVSGVCPGETYTTGIIVNYECDGNNQLLQVYPNPARDNISVDMGEAYPASGEGVDVLISRIGGGVSPKSARIYNNGQSINVSDMPEGAYYIQTLNQNFQPLSTSFIISRD